MITRSWRAKFEMENVVKDPLGEIQRRLTAGTTAGSDPRSCDADWGLKKELALALHGPGFEGIPLLTDRSFHSGELKNHTLVRTAPAITI
jgi:hypothetical protein